MRAGKSKGLVTLPREPRSRSIQSWAVEVQRALCQLRDRINTPPPAPQKKTAPLPPFWVRLYRVDGGWEFAVEHGYILSQNIGNGGDPVSYVMPTLDGVPLDSDTTRPMGTLPGSTAFVYVKVLTTAKGVVSGTPTVEVFAAAQTSIHHHPASPENPAVTGVYYFLIAKIEPEDGNPSIKERIVGNRNVPNQLVEIENVGAGKEVYFTYAAGGEDTHEFRTLKERDSQPQIKVVYSNETDPELAEEIIIEGNGVSGTGSQVTVVDGLVTAIGAASGAADLNLTVQTLEWLNNADVMEFVAYGTDIVHYWRGGVYVGTTNPNDNPAGLIQQTVTRMTESS